MVASLAGLAAQRSRWPRSVNWMLKAFSTLEL
jgi:hypothetical protein